MVGFQTEYHRNRIELVSSFVKNITGYELTGFIKTLGWKDKLLSLHLINDTLTDKETSTIYECSGGANKHRMDNRNPAEFYLNLVLGWGVENAIIFYLRKNKIKAVCSGSDNQRSIQNSFVTNTPDLSVLPSKKFIEVVMSFYDTGMLALRDNKYLNLKMYNSSLLGINLQTQKAIFIKDIGKITPASTGYNNKFGKPTTNIDTSRMKTYEMSEVIKEIKTL